MKLNGSGKVEGPLKIDGPMYPFVSLLLNLAIVHIRQCRRPWSMEQCRRPWHKVDGQLIETGQKFRNQSSLMNLDNLNNWLIAYII